MQEQAAQVQTEAAEQRQYVEALEAPIPHGYAYAVLRPNPWGEVIADFQYFAPLTIITRRAQLGTPRAALLAQLAQGGAQ